MTFIDFMVIAMVVIVTALAVAYYWKDKVIKMFGKTTKTKKIVEDDELIEDELNKPDPKLVKQTKEMMGIRKPDEPEAEMPPPKPKEEPEPKITAPKRVVIAQIYKDTENGTVGIQIGDAFNPMEFYAFIMPHAKALEQGLVDDHTANFKKLFEAE